MSGSGHITPIHYEFTENTIVLQRMLQIDPNDFKNSDLLSAFITQAMNIIKILNKLRIHHNDLHINNWVYTADKNIGRRYYLIDFGHSEIFPLDSERKWIPINPDLLNREFREDFSYSLTGFDVDYNLENFSYKCLDVCRRLKTVVHKTQH